MRETLDFFLFTDAANAFKWKHDFGHFSSLPFASLPKLPFFLPPWFALNVCSNFSSNYVRYVLIECYKMPATLFRNETRYKTKLSITAFFLPPSWWISWIKIMFVQLSLTKCLRNIVINPKGSKARVEFQGKFSLQQFSNLKTNFYH